MSSGVIKNHFEIVVGDKVDSKSFLISSNGYDYYLNGYDVDSSYILLNESSKYIINEDISYAREKIKSKVFSFVKDGNNFKIYKLRNALYNYIIDASWLVKYDYIEIVKSEIEFNKFEIIKDFNHESIEYDDEVNKERLKIINLDINIELDSINGIDEFIKNEYKIDYLINQIEKKYYLSLVSGNGKYTSNELRIYEVDNFSIGVEYGFVDNYLVYYVYLIR